MYLICGVLNSLGDLRIQSIARVYDRSSLLKDTKGLNKRRRKTFLRATNIEVLEGTRLVSESWITSSEEKHTVVFGHPNTYLKGLGGRRKCHVQYDTSVPPENTQSLNRI